MVCFDHNNIEGVDLIILDFDGTLFDTRPAICACLKLTLEYYDHVIDKDLIDLAISRGLTLDKTFEMIVQDPRANIDCYVDTYRLIYESENCEALAKIYPGVKQVIIAWQRRGIPLVILSNKGDKAIHSLLERHYLSSYFCLVIGSNSPVEKKPNTESYDKIISSYFKHIPAHKTMVIGDTATDIHFAHNIGASSTWVSYGYGDKQACAALKPRYISDGLIKS